MRAKHLLYTVHCVCVGGEKVLEKVLTPSAKQHVELAQLRTHIRRCFSSIRCFLMPHPGLEVATNQQFDGRLDVVDRSFRGALMELMPILFRPENLVAKQIDNADVEIGELVGALRCAHFSPYFTICLSAPQSAQSPLIVSIYPYTCTVLILCTVRID